MNIRNRIKEMRIVSPEEVMPNPKNWRVHPQAQRDALRGVLSSVGIAAPVIAYETPFGLKLIDGHERMTIGIPFPAIILDVNDAEADLLLATFDPITTLATADTDLLDALLRDINTDSPAIATMLDDLAKQNGLYADKNQTFEGLEEEFGEHQESDFWPQIILRVSQPVLSKWQTVFNNYAGTNDNDKLEALLSEIEANAD